MQRRINSKQNRNAASKEPQQTSRSGAHLLRAINLLLAKMQASRTNLSPEDRAIREFILRNGYCELLSYTETLVDPADRQLLLFYVRRCSGESLAMNLIDQNLVTRQELGELTYLPAESVNELLTSVCPNCSLRMVLAKSEAACSIRLAKLDYDLRQHAELSADGSGLLPLLEMFGIDCSAQRALESGIDISCAENDLNGLSAEAKLNWEINRSM